MRLPHGKRLPKRYLLPLRILAFGLVAFVAIPGTWALATATANNPSNQASLTALYYPTAAASVPVARTSQTITWTLPTNNNGNGFGIMAQHLAWSSGATCPTALAGYQPAAGNWVSSVASSTATYSDTSAFATNMTYEGGYVCYLIQSGYKPGSAAPGWTAMPGSTGNTGWESLQSGSTANAPTSAIAQGVVGFVATSITWANGNVAGSLDKNDTLTITFSQPVNTATVNIAGQNLCNSGGSTIIVGDASSNGNCGATGTLGNLTGGTLAGNKTRWAIGSAVWSSTAAGANTKLVLTVSSTSTSTQTISGTWTLVPNTGIFAASGFTAICTTNPASGKCQPVTTTNP